MELNNQAVEHLVFLVDDANKIEEFVTLDHQIWTNFLSQQDGFIQKDIWVNYANKQGEIHSVVIWETLEQWKAISLDALMTKDKEFTNAFSGKFSMIREIHKENNHQMKRVSSQIGKMR